MTDQPIEDEFTELAANITIRQGNTLALATVALGGTRPVLVVTPTADPPAGVLSFDVDSTGMGDTTADVADTLDLLVTVLRGDDSPARDHATELLEERAKVRAGTYGPDHDREHGYAHLAALAVDRLTLVVYGIDSANDRRTWVEVGQFVLAALELIDTQGAEASA